MGKTPKTPKQKVIMNIYQKLYIVAKERCIAIGKNEAWIFEKEYANAVIDECIKVINDPKLEIKLREHFSTSAKEKPGFRVYYSNQGTNAATLDADVVGYSETSGWTIVAEIHEDHFTWINYFEATHPKYGYVKGDFEGMVEAASESAIDHFLEHYTIHNWDYSDI